MMRFLKDFRVADLVCKSTSKLVHVLEKNAYQTFFASFRVSTSYQLE